MSLCLVSASLTVTLAKPTLSGTDHQPAVRQSVSDFLRRMSPYFPFPNRPSPSGISPGFDISLAFASLVMSVGPSPPRLLLPRTTESEGWKGRIKAIQQAWSQAGSLPQTTKSSSTKAGGFSLDWAVSEVADWICMALVSWMMLRTRLSSQIDLGTDKGRPCAAAPACRLSSLASCHLAASPDLTARSFVR